ncbi:hypothetical protein CQY22_010075 [Mycolicibacterium brumae]|uniref:Uncharacterized protein n=1 Tax=Mycolicibacterium brumae TaxID=85968 RepID=A0A2G5PA34_9MYCO|nr:hypothetical protein CQY22_010075 [Mycolicibacterium brumae]
MGGDRPEDGALNGFGDGGLDRLDHGCGLGGAFARGGLGRRGLRGGLGGRLRGGLGGGLGGALGGAAGRFRQRSLIPGSGTCRIGHRGDHQFA